MMHETFSGTGVALVTPFNDDLTVDYVSLGKIIDNQINNGIDYLVVLGTTAETPTLSSGEQKEIIDFVKEKNNHKLPVVIGMGGNDPEKIIQKMALTDWDDIAGILVVTPFYNKPSQEGMFQHYKKVVEASPVPVILYNVPSRTGVNIEAETVVRIAHLSDKVAGIKEASGISSQVSKIVKHAPPHFSVISGDDVLALPIISVGGKGLISVIANVLPGKISALVHHALEENYPEARELHLNLLNMFGLLFKEGNPAGVKAALHATGLISNVLRLPLCAVSSDTYREIATELENL